MKRQIKYLLLFALLSRLSLGISLAHADEPPTLALKDAIPVAEEALTKAGVDLSQYYLYQGEYSLSSRGNYWYLTYRARVTRRDNEIFISVYMDKTTDISGVGNVKRRY